MHKTYFGVNTVSEIQDACEALEESGVLLPKTPSGDVCRETSNNGKCKRKNYISIG